MQPDPIRIFISYTHDSPEHSQRVLNLGNLLRSEGFDCDLDQYHSNQDWPAWMERNIENADFVLVICTPTYLRRWNNEATEGAGLGAQWESLLTRQHLYLSPGLNDKFVPVIFDSEDVAHIPIPLTNVTRVLVGTDDGFERLRYRLLNIAPAEKPPLMTSLAPYSLAPGFFAKRDIPIRPKRQQNLFDHRPMGLLAQPETLFSNLLPVTFPSHIYSAQIVLKRGVNFKESLAAAWRQLGGVGQPPVDFLIDARVLYRFTPLTESVWRMLVERKILHLRPAKQSSDWALSNRTDDKNRFIRLLNHCLDQLCAAPGMAHEIIWSKEMRCHLFAATPGSRIGRIKVRAIKKEGTREVYKAIRDKTSEDQNAIQHWQHQAFRHFFVRFGEEWFLNVTPFWAFSSDGRGFPSRWQKTSSANMRKPEKNRAVLGHVMFWASVLCREADLVRTADPFQIRRPVQVEGMPSIDDASWVKTEKETEKLILIADMDLPL